MNISKSSGTLLQILVLRIRSLIALKAQSYSTQTFRNGVNQFFEHTHCTKIKYSKISVIKYSKKSKLMKLRITETILFSKSKNSSNQKQICI